LVDKERDMEENRSGETVSDVIFEIVRGRKDQREKMRER
jgi:hypothetical protein